jgi:hypothetical protein
LTPAERERQSRRRTLELALIRARADAKAARSDLHRQQLAQAIAALEDELHKLQWIT